MSFIAKFEGITLPFPSTLNCIDLKLFLSVSVVFGLSSALIQSFDIISTVSLLLGVPLEVPSTTPPEASLL